MTRNTFGLMITFSCLYPFPLIPPLSIIVHHIKDASVQNPWHIGICFPTMEGTYYVHTMHFGIRGEGSFFRVHSSEVTWEVRKGGVR